MGDLAIWLCLLVIVGAGYALVIAGIEFVQGIRIGVNGGAPQPCAGQDGAGRKADDGRAQQHQRAGDQSGESPAVPLVRPWHEVLGVGANASAEDVRRAYRQSISLYHPDRLAGLAPELQALAEKRAKEINAAYDAASRRR